MIRHDDLWQALDLLATERGLTPSGLARAAGLDATCFNPSKRTTPTGRPRWPGTESLARVLDATGLTLEAFGRLVGGHLPRQATRAARSRLRLAPLSHLDQAGMFDPAGLPSGRHWDHWDMPGGTEADLYAVTVDTDALEPVFRMGTILIMSPGAPIRRDDRVLALRADAALCAVVVDPRGAPRGGALLAGLGTQAEGTIETGPADPLHRILMTFL